MIMKEGTINPTPQRTTITREKAPMVYIKTREGKK
jgi:hypothetical protein